MNPDLLMPHQSFCHMDLSIALLTPEGNCFIAAEKYADHDVAAKPDKDTYFQALNTQRYKWFEIKLQLKQF